MTQILCPHCGHDLRESGPGLGLDQEQRSLVYSAAFWLRRAAKATARGREVSGLKGAKVRAWECVEQRFLPASLNAELRQLLEADAPEAKSSEELAEALIWAASS